MKKIALFDMDGTLTDTERVFRDTWMELPAEFGVAANPDFPKAVCGSNGENMINIIHHYFPTVDPTKFMNACFARVAAKNAICVPVKEGVKEILDYMKENDYKMAVTSSNFRVAVERTLEDAGLRPYFDLVLGGDDVALAKPNPDIYQAAAAYFEASPEECYAFEDGLNGIRSALAAGCKTYMIVDLTEPDEEYAPKCAGIYDCFSDFLNDLKNDKL